MKKILATIALLSTIQATMANPMNDFAVNVTTGDGYEYTLNGYVHDGGPNGIENSEMVITGELAEDIYLLADESDVIVNSRKDISSFKVQVKGWSCLRTVNHNIGAKVFNLIRNLSPEVDGSTICSKRLF